MADKTIKDEVPVGEYAFRIFLPVKSENNAKIVNDDGRELTWFFDLTKQNVVEVSFVLFNIVNTAILAVVLIFLPILICLVSKLKKQKSKKCPYCGEFLDKGNKENKFKEIKNLLIESLKEVFGRIKNLSQRASKSSLWGFFFWFFALFFWLQ